jgi:hypothetical protein
VSEETGVRVYGFFDDINLLGTPQQLMAALTHLQQSLPAVSLHLNTAVVCETGNLASTGSQLRVAERSCD